MVSESAASTCKCGPGLYDEDGVCQSCPDNTVCRSLEIYDQRFCYAGKIDCVCNYGYTGPDGGPCTECAVGTYKDTLGSTACVSCPDVFHHTEWYRVQKQDCVCVPGFIDDGYLSYACRPCAPGTYSNQNSANRFRYLTIHECTHCPVGTYASRLASTVCDACPTGTYGSRTKMGDVRQCTSCVAGTFSNKNGASSMSVCEPGPAGYYSSVIAADATHTCAQCVAGKYSTATGAASEDTCVPCAADRFSTAGASACLCPDGTYAEDASAACVPCAASYSRTFPPSTPGTLTWALQNLRLVKQLTCSVAGTVRCKETRTTRLCGDSRLRHARHPHVGAFDTFAAHSPGCDRQRPLLCLYASGFVCSPQASPRLLHIARTGTTASCQDQRARRLYYGTSTWPRRGLSSPSRLGAHVPRPWPSFVMGASRQTARHLHITVHQPVVSGVL
jgi:hypothetical protein